MADSHIINLPRDPANNNVARDDLLGVYRNGQTYRAAAAADLFLPHSDTTDAGKLLKVNTTGGAEYGTNDWVVIYDNSSGLYGNGVNFTVTQNWANFSTLWFFISTNGNAERSNPVMIPRAAFVQHNISIKTGHLADKDFYCEDTGVNSGRITTNEARLYEIWGQR